jgi:hypothetical protein
VKFLIWCILVAALLAAVPQVAAAGGETGNGRAAAALYAR